MYFLVDNERKIIFGCSTKCGCSHIKTIWWFLINDKIENEIHTSKDRNDLPDDIENYTSIIISRNPYKRIVSGFLEKYGKNGDFRHLWKHSTLSFSKFVNKVIISDWKTIDELHFAPQTSQAFDKKILSSKIIKFYDICNIDYTYIENLFKKKIPECVINKKMGHERIYQIKKTPLNKNLYNLKIYNLNIDKYIHYDIDVKYFYNEKIRQQIFDFYRKDFIFFYENGIDYINSPL
jgi:hypothetical protein